MKLAMFLLLANVILAQEAPKVPMPTAPVVTATNSDKSVIVIDSKARTNDFVQAFDMLRKDKPTLKIMVRTSSTTFQNVTDIAAAPGGTLLLIKVLSNQGPRIQIVPVEEMMEINYSP